MKLIIENCEKKLSEWLWLEYKHAAEIWGSTIFANVKDAEMRRRLSSIAEVQEESFNATERSIILDPQAEEELRQEDFSGADDVVIGGILGYEIPKGRTAELIASKAKNAMHKNLGKIQLTIDSAALVAKLIFLGMELDDIEITKSVEIMYNDKESVVLPYGYVVADGRVIITPGLAEYLSH